MDHPRLRRLMEKHHNFLYQLYSNKTGRQNRTLLKKASGSKVRLVLRLLFCISVGHIPLTQKNYDRLIQSRRRNNLGQLRNRMRRLKNGPIYEQRKFILQFAVLYPNLFYDIFNVD